MAGLREYTYHEPAIVWKPKVSFNDKGRVLFSQPEHDAKVITIIMSFFTFQLGTVSSWPVVMVLHSNEVPLVSLYAIHALITAAIGIL